MKPGRGLKLMVRRTNRKLAAKMKAHVFLFGVFMVATANAAERWWSPDKFSLYCSTSRLGGTASSKTTAGSSYAFTSPDGQSEVRVSATYHLR